MQKRFTDRDMWKKKWFRLLTSGEKAAWRYINDMCDNAGVWDVDFELANFYIGEDIDWEAFRQKTNGNIEEIAETKWWLTEFVDFQFGDLRDEESVTDKARLSYIRLLKKHGLWEIYQNQGAAKGLDRGIQGAYKGLDRGMYAHKAKEKEKEKEKEKRGTKKIRHPVLEVPIGQTQYDRLCADYGQGVVDDYISRCLSWVNAHGKKPFVDYAAAAENWMKRDGVEKYNCDHPPVYTGPDLPGVSYE